MSTRTSLDVRWLTWDEIDEVLNPACLAQGYAELNVNPSQPLCRVLGAFDEDGQLIEAFAFQMYPILGPLIKVDNTFRDNGDTARQLCAQMGEFLEEVQARGYLCIAESPVTQRLCERFGMTQVNHPVYSFVRT